ncbi:DUF3127 domain-containing protein [Larkinella humicola]|uniref:DUF3127 domain-containing protein n=1 Tax=Larkinella humicola TaxID=2607654 RepID=A0A5N1J5X3_9BACT|nr:DUF3127 domain-containing protein [Larkinella humicola]KAA9346311.1 DUF3127 domain-containing protein [Larkinella humicola]
MQDSQVITGKFFGAGAIKYVGENNYAVRSFWIDITTNPDFPNTPEFQLKGDKVNLVNELRKGQSVVIKYNLDGRKYDKTAEGGRKGVITNLNAWRIEVVQMQLAATVATAPQAAPALRPAGLPQPAPTSPSFQEEDNDLRF